MNLFDKYRARLKDLTPADEPTREEIPQPVRKPEEIVQSNVCSTCHKYAWWESVYGRIVCGVCHPPRRERLSDG